MALPSPREWPFFRSSDLFRSFRRGLRRTPAAVWLGAFLAATFSGRRATGQSCPEMMLDASTYGSYSMSVQSTGSSQAVRDYGDITQAIDDDINDDRDGIAAHSRLIVTTDSRLITAALITDLSLPATSRSLGADATGTATLRVCLSGGATSNTVIVRTVRMVQPKTGSDGSGTSRVTKAINELPWGEYEEKVYAVAADGCLDPIPLECEAHAQQSGDGGGMLAVVAVMVGTADDGCQPEQPLPNFDDPNNDYVNPNDDQPPPCPGDPAGGNGGPSDPGCWPGFPHSGGGLHIRNTTGDVWTRVPVFTSYSAEGKDLECVLRYDSLRANQDFGLGLGWRHSFQIGLEDVSGELVFRGGNGRRLGYQPWTFAGLTIYLSPPGESSFLFPFGDYWEILKPDGTRFIFHPVTRAVTAIIDRRGRTTSFEYGDYGVTRVVSPYGREALFAYDGPAHHLSSITAPDGTVTTLEQSASGDDYVLASITDPVTPTAGEITYQYSNGYMTQEHLKNGTEFNVAYDTNCRTLTDDENNVIAVVASEDGFPDLEGETIGEGTVTVVDGNEYTWTISRNAVGQVTQVVTPEDSHTWTYEWGGATDGNAANRIKTITDPRGYTKEYSWGYGGRVTGISEQVKLAPDPVYVGTTYDYHWEYRAVLTKITEADGDEWEYEIAGNDGSAHKKGDLISITDPLHESPTDKKIYFSYETWDDDEGLPTGIDALPGRIQTRTVTDRNGHDTVYAYSAKGDLTSRTIDPDPGLNLVTEFEHDDMGRATQATVHRSETEDAVTSYTYDQMGRRLTQVVDPGELELTTQWSHDAHGLLTGVVNPRGFRTAYAHDLRNRRITMTEDADGDAPLVTHYEYDLNDNLTRVVDVRGHDMANSYTPENLRYLSIDAENYKTMWAFDGPGNLIRQQRERTVGQFDWEVQEWDHDGLNRVTAQRRFTDTGESPSGALETLYEYATPQGCGCGGTPGRALVHKITDSGGKVTYRLYDDLDRLVGIRRKVGSDDGPDEDAYGDDSLSTFEYDAVGNSTASVGPEGQRVENEYDAANRRSTQTADPSGAALVTHLTYDGANNLVGGVLPNGNEITLLYDLANRLRESSDSAGPLYAMDYDENGNVLVRENGEAEEWLYEYDHFDRLTVIKDPIVESGTDAVEHLYYDRNSNLKSRSDRKGRITRYTYDKLNRQTLMVEDAGTTVTGDGDGDGDVDGDDAVLFANCYGTSPLSEDCEVFDFDSDGDVDGDDQDAFDYINPTSASTVYLLRRTATAYDGPGRVKSLTAWTENSSSSAQTETTTYAYDGAARLQTVTYPDSGEVAYTHTEVGRVHTRYDQKGVTATYSYDDLHRLTERSYDDSLTPTDSFGYDKSGKLTSANNSVAELAFEYDALDRLLSAAQTLDSSTFSTGFEYDVSSTVNRRTVTYPSGAEIVENFDARDRLADITAESTTIYDPITYDDADRLTARTSGPGGISSYTYDADSRLTQIEHDNSAPAALVKLAYGYDAVGNRKYKEDLASGFSNRSEVYIYDGLHRLRDFRRGTLNSTKDGISTPVAAPLTYTQEWLDFDLLGNWQRSRTRVYTSPATVTTDYRTVNEVNEYLTRKINSGSTVSLTHDVKGNLTDAPGVGGAPGYAYTYDAENRLATVSKKGSPDVLVQTYQYDALSRRVKTTDNCPAGCTGGVCGSSNPSGTTVDTWHIYADGPACVEEYSSTPTLLRYFVHGAEFPDPLAMIDNTAAGASGAGTHEFFWYLKDALGSVVALKNASDAVVERYVYDAYGKTVVTNSSGTPLSANGDCNALEVASAYGNPFCWTGQRYDPRVGLYHFWFRTYSPSLGRWLQRDPLGSQPSAPITGEGRRTFSAATTVFPRRNWFGCAEVVPEDTSPADEGRRSSTGYYDEMSLYQALRGNPIARIDPTGALSVDCGTVKMICKLGVCTLLGLMCQRQCSDAYGPKSPNPDLKKLQECMNFCNQAVVPLCNWACDQIFALCKKLFPPPPPPQPKGPVAAGHCP